MGKQQRHTAGHSAGHAALTSSMDMQVSISKRDSMEIKHGNAARA
jgi:hypothetical protein